MFALQGLRKNVFGLGNLGVTTFFFTFYGIILSATYNNPRTGVTINLVIILILLVYLILSKPGFHFIPRVLLYAAYFIFFIAKLLLLLYVYNVFQKASGNALCDAGLAIIGLFFASICLLLLGLLASLFFSFKFKNYFFKLFADNNVYMPDVTGPNGLLPGNDHQIDPPNVVYLERQTRLLPDDDKSVIEPPEKINIERPSQMIRRYQESNIN